MVKKKTSKNNVLSNKNLLIALGLVILAIILYNISGIENESGLGQASPGFNTFFSAFVGAPDAGDMETPGKDDSVSCSGGRYCPRGTKCVKSTNKCVKYCDPAQFYCSPSVDDPNKDGICDKQERVCVSCFINEDGESIGCDANPNGEVCIGTPGKRECVQCSSDDHCPVRNGNQDHDFCVDNKCVECTKREHCGDKEVCTENKCVPITSCRGDDGFGDIDLCKEPYDVCYVSGYSGGSDGDPNDPNDPNPICVACANNPNVPPNGVIVGCDDPRKPACDFGPALRRCVECTGDSHCPNDKPKCMDYECVERCVENSDCPEGYWCANNPRECVVPNYECDLANGDLDCPRGYTCLDPDITGARDPYCVPLPKENGDFIDCNPNDPDACPANTKCGPVGNIGNKCKPKECTNSIECSDQYICKKFLQGGTLSERGTCLPPVPATGECTGHRDCPFGAQCINDKCAV